MPEQGLAVVSIESEQHVPQVAGLAWQLPGSTAMPVVDGLRNGGVVETGCLAAEDDVLNPNLKTGVRRAVIEQAEAERVQYREERHVRVLSERIAQGKRAVRRELSHQPIGDRLQSIIFLRPPPARPSD
jgi:hypothetical protein